MGTENIVFLDLVVVSRLAIIPEISLRYYALITWEHVFNLKKKKNMYYQKMWNELVKGCFCECVSSSACVCEGGEL